MKTKLSVFATSLGFILTLSLSGALAETALDPSSETEQYSIAAKTSCELMPPQACDIFKRTNAYRIQSGRRPLTVSRACVRAAEYHAKNMALNKFFAHDAPNESWRQRMKRYGLLGSIVAENIALTSQGSNHALQLWVNSAPHRKNMLDGRFQSAGMGYYQGYYVQCFSGSPGI